ncbi:MAG: primosomal protein N' [Candidatus Aenigmarchaeota archaeon]|nr:primosomal protein N' [Candidatus Aenigmarchaeota archaeon]
MKYVEVVPFTYTQKSTQTFFYKVPREFEKNVKVGQLVRVPLLSRKILGVILDLGEKKPKFHTKDIIEIVDQNPVLIPHLIPTAKWMANYYCASLFSVVQNMLPRGIGKKRRKVKNELGAQSLKPRDKKKINLTNEQKRIINEIKKCQSSELIAQSYLIHGITGSGKTEIYLKIIEEILKKGKGAIVLVPEVALTPQTVNRFEERFSGKVALLHSYLKETERANTWQKIRNGEFLIVVGSRSALFAPLKNLGVIIIDEEHETSYKQDQTPRYHAIKVAQKIVKNSNSILILGSATPSIESYFKAKKENHLFRLTERVGGGELPKVKIVDLKQEFKKGNRSIFSEDLAESLKETLKKGRQAILFLNRRGTATFILCRDCGYVLLCPNCEVPYTYHTDSDCLLCHHCNKKDKPPTLCPNCQGPNVKFFGLGTQKVEQEIKKLLPKAKIIRMDKDTTKKRGSHLEIYNNFLNKKYNILVGTQMIAKGWDLPNIDLVGVVSADTSLYFPDFRAAERTFQLLTQVAGRTNRGQNGGEVIIQTYNPESFAIKCAKNHDFESFYSEEIGFRKSLSYPPFSNLVKLTYINTDLKKCQEEPEKVSSKLKALPRSASPAGRRQADQSSKLIILGPAPCFIPKIRGKFRYQIIIKIDDITKLIEILRDLDKNWSCDVDPLTTI